MALNSWLRFTILKLIIAKTYLSVIPSHKCNKILDFIKAKCLLVAGKPFSDVLVSFQHWRMLEIQDGVHHNNMMQ